MSDRQYIILKMIAFAKYTLISAFLMILMHIVGFRLVYNRSINITTYDVETGRPIPYVRIVFIYPWQGGALMDIASIIGPHSAGQEKKFVLTNKKGIGKLPTRLKIRNIYWVEYSEQPMIGAILHPAYIKFQPLRELDGFNGKSERPLKINLGMVHITKHYKVVNKISIGDKLISSYPYLDDPLDYLNFLSHYYFAGPYPVKCDLLDKEEILNEWKGLISFWGGKGRMSRPMIIDTFNQVFGWRCGIQI